MDDNFSEPESEPETQQPEPGSQPQPEPGSQPQSEPGSQPQPEPRQQPQPRLQKGQPPGRLPPTSNPPETHLKNLHLTKALFDVSIFITYHNHDQIIRQAIGNPQIFHTEVTEEEWRKQFKYHKNPRRLAEEKTARGLAVFNSTFLPETPEVIAVAKEIERCLREGGIEDMESRELTDNDWRDIMTVAYGIVHRVDVVARDKLFFTIEKMFATSITVYVDRKQNSMRQAWRMVTRLEELGKQIPPELSHLLRLNSSADIEKDMEKARQSDDTNETR